MTEPIINILRLIFIGTATTIVRIIGQLAIPTSEQTVLSPSIFAQNGTMPVAFTTYGIFAYSLIAALFLLIRKRTGGNRIWQGLRYGFACCAVWIVYLWEPLPHVAPLDRITYPVADGLALIVMGLLLGWLFGQTRLPVKKRSRKLPALPGLIITLCFIAGAAASVLRYRYLFVLPRKNRRDPVMVPAGRFCDCLRYGVAEPLCGR